MAVHWAQDMFLFPMLKHTSPTARELRVGNTNIPLPHLLHNTENPGLPQKLTSTNEDSTGSSARTCCFWERLPNGAGQGSFET